MLERKRILKQIQTEDRDRGRVLIYEHAKTGDVFIVPDPQLHLDELDAVQTEVVALNDECSNDENRRCAFSLSSFRISSFNLLPMLPWFSNGRFPLYLAPMAGVSDKIFRQLCKERGADVLVTEFVSSEGVFRRNARTRGYLDFDEIERPIGVQLFGGNAEHMAEAARQVVEWVQPDFIDLNFGCPVNKVVAKNGGSALLKDCPTLGRVAEAVVRAVAPLPVTAKIRTGWDDNSVNAVSVAQLLESLGIAALAVHGRTRAQGYSGAADWEVIAQVAAAVSIPVIGNGDLFGAADVAQSEGRNRASPGP